MEGSAAKKVRGMSLQYPTTQEAVYLCNGAISEKSPQILRPLLPAEYVTAFSGRTEAPEVRCDLTDRQTHRHTDPTTVTLAAHVRRGLKRVRDGNAQQVRCSMLAKAAHNM